MSYRKFSLTNRNNEVWEFSNKQIKSFLNNPKNLGFEQSFESERYGDKKIISKTDFSFPKPGGTVLFCDSKNEDRYSKYYDFCRFLTYSPLKLTYVLPLSTPVSYYLECYVSKLSKSESDKSTLSCEVEFEGVTFWKADEIQISGNEMTYTIDNTSDMPVGFEIKLEGSMINPYVTLEQNNELYGEAKFIDSVAFEKVYIDSVDGEQNVVLQQDGSILPNPLSYQDLSISNGAIYVTFIKLARGETTLTIGMDSGLLNNVEIRFTPIYRSV